MFLLRMDVLEYFLFSISALCFKTTKLLINLHGKLIIFYGLKQER